MAVPNISIAVLILRQVNMLHLELNFLLDEVPNLLFGGLIAESVEEEATVGAIILCVLAGSFFVPRLLRLLIFWHSFFC